MTRDPAYWALLVCSFLNYAISCWAWHRARRDMHRSRDLYADALAKNAEAHGILAMVQAHAARTRGAS